MSRSQRLSLSDVRAVFHLLGEVCELGARPDVWRAHMLRGLCHLIDATKAHAGEAPLNCSATAPRFAGVVIEGADDLRSQAIYRALIGRRDYADDPCSAAMAKLIHKSFTCTRQAMADDKAWYRRRDVDMWRTLGTDQFVYSHQLLRESGCIHLVALNRDWGRPPFGERARRIVHLFHAELGQLWQRQAVQMLDWAPRLRQTLALLLQGCCEKEIAARLDLSRHTVHDYAKVVYRRLDVHSQAQLLVHPTVRAVARAPQLVCVDHVGHEVFRPAAP